MKTPLVPQHSGKKSPVTDISLLDIGKNLGISQRIFLGKLFNNISLFDIWSKLAALQGESFSEQELSEIQEWRKIEEERLRISVQSSADTILRAFEKPHIRVIIQKLLRDNEHPVFISTDFPSSFVGRIICHAFRESHRKIQGEVEHFYKPFSKPDYLFHFTEKLPKISPFSFTGVTSNVDDITHWTKGEEYPRAIILGRHLEEDIVYKTGFLSSQLRKQGINTWDIISSGAKTKANATTKYGFGDRESFVTGMMFPEVSENRISQFSIDEAADALSVIDTVKFKILQKRGYFLSDIDRARIIDEEMREAGKKLTEIIVSDMGELDTEEFTGIAVFQGGY